MQERLPGCDAVQRTHASPRRARLSLRILWKSVQNRQVPPLSPLGAHWPVPVQVFCVRKRFQCEEIVRKTRELALNSPPLSGSMQFKQQMFEKFCHGYWGRCACTRGTGSSLKNFRKKQDQKRKFCTDYVAWCTETIILVLLDSVAFTLWGTGMLEMFAPTDHKNFETNDKMYELSPW